MVHLSDARGVRGEAFAHMRSVVYRPGRIDSNNVRGEDTATVL